MKNNILILTSLLTVGTIIVGMTFYVSQYRVQDEGIQAERADDPLLQATPATDSTTLQIVEAFSQKYSKSTENVIIQTDVDTGQFAKGSVRFRDEMSGGIWFAARKDDNWVLVHDGQGPMTCTLANEYDFPTDLVPGCVDTDNDNVLINRE